MRRWVITVIFLAACGDIDDSSAPPTEAIALHGWLKSGDYKVWNSESEAHPGLNGTRRRVFLNELVDPHGSSVGAAAVRELWNDDAETQLGWSVLVKTSEGWWFYETFHLDNPEEYAAAGFDAPGCTSCHAGAPDTIRSSLPLK